MILYIETNFIIAIAKGQDEKAMEMLQNPPFSVRLAIPGICCMEALFSFEEDRKRRSKFRQLLDYEIKQAKRDKTASDIRIRITALEESLLAYDAVFNEVQTRFFEAIQLISNQVELIQLTSNSLAMGFTEKILNDREQQRDNLILQCIAHHAEQFTDRKILLTNDQAFKFNNEGQEPTAVQRFLQRVGIEKCFSKTEAFLGWLEGQVGA